VASLRDRVRELLGIRGDGADAVLDAALLGAAQELRRRGFRAVGLLPASPDVIVPPLALQLGLALSLVAPGTTAVVDPGGAWGAPEEAAAGSPLAAVAITARLSLLTRAARAPEVRDLEELLAPERAAARQLVVDLGPFERVGEHLAAMALLDGVAVIARAGRTKLPDVERRLREVPAARSAGVLLVE
jgi:hypothetical protein